MGVFPPVQERNGEGAFRRFVDFGVIGRAKQNQVLVGVGTAAGHTAPPCRLSGYDVSHLT
jgi:hypothetical protein